MNGLRLTSLVVLTCALMLSLGGCPPPPAATLTAGQQAAVNQVATQLAAAGRVFGTAAPLADSRLDLDSLATADSFGTCPAVSFIAGSTNVVMLFNFAGGCSGPATGGDTVSGAVSVTANRTTRGATFAFENLVTVGHAITWSLSATISPRATGVNLAGECDLNTAQVGEASGTYSLDITAEGRLTLSAPGLALNNGTATYTVVLDGLVMDPVHNGNFVPQSGTAAFQVAGEGGGPPVAVVITFTASSPTAGTVQVSIAGAAAASYTVPGLAP